MLKSKILAVTLTACMWACGGVDKPAAPMCQENTATQIALPDGSKGGVICCQHRADCYKLGTKVCNTYDITLANNTTSTDFATNDHPVEYVVQCKVK